MKSLTLVTFSLYSFCLWLIFASSLCTLCFCNHNSHKVQCMAIERLALTQFKNNLVDKANRLASWSGEDCCSWSGVVCDKFTHHVQELRLRGPDDGIHGHCNGSLVTYYEIEEAKSQMLGGIISPSLIKLEQLEYLDLSCNDFGLIQIPAFIGSLENLRYLNISNSQFYGTIPHQLGNLSSLLVLDVHTDELDYLVSTNLKWIENLKQLQYLNMGGIDLTESSNWLQAINILPSLQELHLSSCGLRLNRRHPLTTVNFTSLIILDISHNFFYGLLPEWVSSLRKLIMLDFSGCSNLNIGSQVGFDRSLRTPPISKRAFVDGLNTLSNLRFLDISNCDLYEPILGKLQNLSLIVHLDLSNNHIVEKIPKSLSNLCNLTTLDLKNNNFSGDVTQLLGRFCECQLPKLESLALSANLLTGQLPEKLGRLKNMVRIDLAYNKLTGILPRSLGSLSSLKTLQLNVNQLKGSIPDSVGDLASLEILDLSYNRFSGNLPESIGKLGKLISLDLHHNSLTGIVTENHLSNLTTLSTLWVEENKLAFDIVNSWIPPFQLKELRMGSCSVGLLFPSWVQSQTNLVEMHLANTNISDTIPNWIWSTFSYLIVLNISHNNIKGKLGDISTLRLRLLDLSSNHFHGEIPSSFNEPHMEFLDLSSNSLSGSLDHFLCSNIREQRPLRVLNLADNNISGGLPDCWTKWETLAILNLQNNKLFGEIPPSLGNSFWLQSLDIRNNKLSGKIPVSLLNSESLVIVKLANNELTGRIPTSIVRKDRILKILSLRSNKLSGEIPKELCRISSLQILDFANNNFSGYLPKCFTNFTVISGKRQPGLIVIYNASLEHDETVLASATLVIKGQFYSYSSILYLVTTFDLSNNNLYGSIPNELVSLPGLRCLNLSHNKLSGIIPNTFGAMRELESLDLSVNHLNGEIPLSLAGLSGLSWLNMSYNNLTGTIPIGRQLQTFNETSFIGNALCGAPLAACRPDSNDINGTNDNDDEANDTDWILVICMTVGLVVGFWITIGTLIVSKQWRYTYYSFLDEMKMKLSDFIFFVSMSCKRVKFWV